MNTRIKLRIKIIAELLCISVFIVLAFAEIRNGLILIFAIGSIFSFMDYTKHWNYYNLELKQLLGL